MAKQKLFRVLWVGCKNLDKLHVGPILYLTQRTGSTKKLRPYTEVEAQAIVSRYNLNHKQAYHELEEVTHGRHNLS